jgi:type IV secretion system protein VirB11
MRRELGDEILGFLDDDEVTEVMLNDDGHVWISKFREPSAIETTLIMPVEQSIAFLGTVAAYYGKTIHQADTVIAEVLPLDGSRVNGIIPPTTKQPTFNIRKKAIRIYTLDDYIEAERMTEVDKAIICDAIRDKTNILIAGATGSGKTTFTNAVLHELNIIAPTQRIVSMEDTEELQIPQRNKVRMFKDDHTTMEKLLWSAMRQSPDRIIIGEIRDRAALELLKSWNTGHPGGITTVHANNCLDTLSRIEMLVLEAIPNPMERLIGQSVGLILFIERTEKGPTLTEIMEVVNYDRDRRDYNVHWLKKENQIVNEMTTVVEVA